MPSHQLSSFTVFVPNSQIEKNSLVSGGKTPTVTQMLVQRLLMMMIAFIITLGEIM